MSIHSDQFIPAYTSQLLSHSHFTRMGFSLALGVFPKPLLAGHLRDLLDPLMKSCSDVKGWQPKFTEARRDAVRSISRYIGGHTHTPGSVETTPPCGA